MRSSAPATADVVVVGGGIAGTATAAYLAEAGAVVVLVEREAIAAGASGRNSGVVQAPVDPVLAALYRETLAAYRRLEAAAAAPFALPAAPAGLLHVTHDPDVAARLAAALAAAAPELRPEYLDPRAARSVEPGLHPAVAAVRVAIGYPVAPAAATRAYAALAERRGVAVRIGRPAELVREGSRVTGVRVADSTIAAGAVVVAAGPWTPAIVDPTGRWRPIRPLWGVVAEVTLPWAPRHVLEEAEIDDAIEPGADEGPTGLAFSLVTADGRSVLGSTFLEDEPEPGAFVAELRERGARFVPALQDAPVVASRRCARPLSADGRPLVGRVPGAGDLFVVAGHGPWGISTAPATAALVAELVLGRQMAPPAALDAARFGSP